MPVVKIYGYPQCEEGSISAQLNHLRDMEVFKELVKQEIASITELGITDSQITVYLITDMVPPEDNGDIVVEIFLYKNSRRTPEVLRRMAEKVGHKVLNYINDGDGLIEVFPILYDPDENGAWTSAD